MKKVINTITIFFLLFTLSINAGENTGTRSDLAAVGSIIISSSDFIQTHSTLLSKYGLSDSKKLRSETLDGLIRDKILYQYALESRYEITEEAMGELERIKIQALLNVFITNELAAEVVVTDSDLMEIYRRMNTRLKVRHIYSQNKAGIDSLYELLTHGADFETLAGNSFTNSSLKNNNGLLGYVGFDELHPSLEEAAYLLKPGEFSEPVKTSTGYSIIRVEDVSANPLLTENDFLKKKEAIKSLARKKKQEIFLQKYIQEVVNSLNIRYNKVVLEKLWADYYSSNIQADTESGEISSNPESDDILLTTNNGNWSVADFYKKAMYTSAGQKQMVLDPEGFKEFINGLIARDEILRRAELKGLSESEKFLKEVNKNFENYLVGRVEEELMQSITISDKDTKQYYSQNEHLFSIPEKINLYGILLDDQKMHDEVLEKLAAGEPFSDLAERYSIQKQTAVKGGELGYFTREELGWIGDEVFKLSSGQYTGGLTMDRKYLIAMCTSKTPNTKAGFDEVEDIIIADLKSYALKSEIQKFISERMSQLEININEELLESIIITRSK